MSRYPTHDPEVRRAEAALNDVDQATLDAEALSRADTRSGAKPTMRDEDQQAEALYDHLYAKFGKGHPNRRSFLQEMIDIRDGIDTGERIKPIGR